MGANSSEMMVAVVATASVAGVLTWRWLRDWVRKPVRPDPWGTEVQESLKQPEAMPVCLHCQSPHDAGCQFCPSCGRNVGDFNNINPYLYLFSLGELLRDGTGGNVRKSWLTVTGYFLLSCIEYALLAPIYWFFLLRNLSTKSSALPPTEASTDAADQSTDLDKSS